MITIITSTYKSEKHLPTFLKSIRKVDTELDKMGVKHEFLILPNDPSPFEINLIKATMLESKNIRLVERKRESLYATWNFGVSESKYDVITFWNVDDIRFSSAIKTLLDEIKPKEPTVAYFPFIYKRYIKILGIDILVKVKKIKVIDFDKTRFLKEMHIGPFFAATKKAFEVNGLFDDTFRIAGDYEWATRAARNNLNFIKIDQLGGIFKNNGASLSGSKDTRQLDENKRVLELANKI